jgi:histidinol phosphatase-like PHP family hydrolase
VVHGETPVEPVPVGTNLAAIEAGADILAHPGLITEACAEAAAKLGTALEVTSRGGHALTNGHVARMLLKFGGSCVVNSDCHAPADLLSPEKRRRVILGAGLPEAFLERMQDHSRKLVEKALQIRSHHA